MTSASSYVIAPKILDRCGIEYSLQEFRKAPNEDLYAICRIAADYSGGDCDAPHILDVSESIEVYFRGLNDTDIFILLGELSREKIPYSISEYIWMDDIQRTQVIISFEHKEII